MTIVKRCLVAEISFPLFPDIGVIVGKRDMKIESIREKPIDSVITSLQLF